MKKILIVKADCNDGDYIEESNEITIAQLHKFAPMFKAIGETPGHNFESGDCVRTESWDEVYRKTVGKDMTEDEWEEYTEEFSDFVPHGEYGIHSIESIRVLTVIEEEKLV